MCPKSPKPVQATPLATPRSEETRRAGNLEAQIRRRQAGVTNDIVTTPLGLPVGGTTNLGG